MSKEQLYYVVDMGRTRDLTVFWRHKGQGYTIDLKEAGLFLREDVKSRLNNDHILVPQHAIVPLEHSIMAIPSCTIKDIEANLKTSKVNKE